MSDSAKGPVPHKPGVYVKGDDQRVANSASAAVALVFDGFVRKDEGPAEDATYRDLQEQAKELDIPANQSAEALREQIDATLSDDQS